MFYWLQYFLFGLYLHFQHALGRFNIHHLTFEGRNITLLGLHIRAQLTESESLRTEFFFSYSKGLISWF